MELIVWVILHVVYQTVGILYFVFGMWIGSKWKYSFSERDPKQVRGSYFVVFYVFFMPTLSHGLIVAMRIADRGFEKFDIKWKMFVIGFLLGIISLLGCQFLLISW